MEIKKQGFGETVAMINYLMVPFATVAIINYLLVPFAIRINLF